MKIHRSWQGIRLRRTQASADPDEPTRPVTLPASWEEAAAAGLAGLAPGDGPASLPIAADAWIKPIAERAAAAGFEDGLCERLHRLLQTRRGAPTESVWRGTPDANPGFVLNLPAFANHHGEFDVAGFAEAVQTAVATLYFAVPTSARISVSMAGAMSRLHESCTASET